MGNIRNLNNSAANLHDPEKNTILNKSSSNFSTGNMVFLSNRKLVLIVAGFIIILFLCISLLDSPKDKFNKYVLNSTHNVQSFIQTLPPTDYSCLIHINFTFTMLPLVCSTSNEPLLILVHSATDHFNHRKVIRETWGHPDNNLKLLFVLGATLDSAVQKQLDEESHTYNDLLQGDFLDAYHNLTYKHVMALKYAVYHCPNVQFLLKVDDDVFVNVPILKPFLKSYVCQNYKPSKIMCSVLYNPPVLRDGKWATSLSDYPNETYPTHCGGFYVIYPQSVIYPLYVESQKSFFWVDDVFVTGMCAKKLNITHANVHKLVLSVEDGVKIVDFDFTNITTPFLIGNINLDEKQIRALWGFVTNHVTRDALEFLNL